MGRLGRVGRWLGRCVLHVVRCLVGFVGQYGGGLVCSIGCSIARSSCCLMHAPVDGRFNGLLYGSVDVLWSVDWCGRWNVG